MSTTQTRTAPHNLDAEAALLGAALLDQHYVEDLVDTVRPEHFYDRRNALVWAAIVRMFEADVPIDHVSLPAALQKSGDYEKAGGPARLAELMQSVSHGAYAAHHARMVLDAAALRDLGRAGTELVRLMHETSLDPEAVKAARDEAERLLVSLASREERGDSEDMQSTIAALLQEIAEGREERPAFTTGLTDIDENVHFRERQLAVVGASQGSGKSAFALQVALRAARADKKTVLFFSLEMDLREICQRVLAHEARVDLLRIQRRNLDLDEKDRIGDAGASLSDVRILIDSASELTITQLRSRARRAAQRHELGLIVVDYLQLVNCPGQEKRYLEVGAVSRALKGLAREIGVPILALAQLNREAEKRVGEDREPKLSDLRESGSIAQDADVVMLLHRHDQDSSEESQALDLTAPHVLPTYGKGVTVDLLVRKNRNGPTTAQRLSFFGQNMRFEASSEKYEPPRARKREPRTREYAGGRP